MINALNYYETALKIRDVPTDGEIAKGTKRERQVTSQWDEEYRDWYYANVVNAPILKQVGDLIDDLYMVLARLRQVPKVEFLRAEELQGRRVRYKEAQQLLIKVDGLLNLLFFARKDFRDATAARSEEQGLRKIDTPSNLTVRIETAKLQKVYENALGEISKLFKSDSPTPTNSNIIRI